MSSLLSVPAGLPFHLQHTLSSLSPLDWLLLAVTLWAVVRGLLRGFIVELFGLLAVAAGLLVASWNYHVVALWLARWISTPSAASVAAFLLLFLVAVAVVLSVARLVRTAARMSGLGFLDRSAGALFALARTALLLAAILSGITAWLPSPPFLRSSRLVPPLLRLAHAVAALAPPDLRHRLGSGLLHLGSTPYTSRQ